jgi:hypothetical protein
MTSRLKLLVILSLATLCAPAFGVNPARPGTVNYIEGSALLAGQPITQQSVGTLALDPGQVLSTEQGHAEILLTPGIYLRLDDNSSVKMISPALTSIQVELDQGRATIEVDEIHRQNDVQIVDDGVPTQVLKTGLYEFDAGNGTARVFSGKATAHEGSKWVVIKGDHQLALSEDADQKPQHFGKNTAKDELYNWSSLRSEYLSKANAELSGYYASAGYAPGWYWDPWFFGYTFIGPYTLYSPFGWDFYPFGYYGGIGGYYGRGYYGHGVYGHPSNQGGFHDGGHYVGGAHGFDGGFHSGGFAGGAHSGGFAAGGHR